MQNILLLAFSIPVMKAVCRNLKFYLLLWESLFIIAYMPCSKQRHLIWTFIFLCFYFFIWMTKGHYNLAFYCICFWSLLSSIGRTHCLCFRQLSALTCSYTHFVPLLKKIKKLKYNVSFLCPHLTHSVNSFQRNDRFWEKASLSFSGLFLWAFWCVYYTLKEHKVLTILIDIPQATEIVLGITV